MISQENKNKQLWQNKEAGVKNLRLFSISLIILELIIIPIYAVFLRVEPHNDTQSIGYSYPSYIDLIVMIVIGSSYFNTYIRTYSYTGMIHTLVFYVVSIQIYFLFAAMWRRIIIGQPLFDRGNIQGTQWTIWIRQQDYTLAAYSCSVMNIVFGILFGRIGFFEKLIIVIFQMFAYTLNSVILNDLLKIYDTGGSIFCHAFGAYFGMGASFIISKFRRPVTKIQHNYKTIIFSYLGCFLIFCFAPSINSQYLTQTPFEKSIVIMNTILAMCASVLTAFAMSVFIKGKFSIIDLFSGCLAGSIGAGSSTSLFVNPAGCMILGAISGVVCVLGTQYLSGWLERKWKIFDTFGIHNVRGPPGIIGGIGGAIAIAISYTIPQDAVQQLPFLLNPQGKSVSKLAGFQIVGLISTLIISLLAGIFTGRIVSFFNNIQPKDFYRDNIYFQIPQESIQKFKRKGTHIKKKQSFLDNNFLEFHHHKHQQTHQASHINLMDKQLHKIKKSSPIKKKVTFQQKIDQTIQKLDNPPVKEQAPMQEQEDEHSQFQQEMKRRREQLEKHEKNMLNN